MSAGRDLAGHFARSGPAAAGAVAHLFDHGAGCPVCVRRAEGGRSWLSAFASEGNADPDVLAKIVAGRGFCAAHTRALIARTDASVLLPGALAAITHGRAAAITRSGAAAITRSGAAALARGGGTGAPACLPCRTERQSVADTVAAVATALGDPVAADVVIGSGRLCTEHLLAVLADAPSRVAPALIDALDGVLAAPDADTLATLAGVDPDVVLRSVFLDRLATELPGRDDSARRDATMVRLLDGLGQARCPTCHAVGEGAVRYLRWLVGAANDETHALDQRQTSLCAVHLHDLAPAAGVSLTDAGVSHVVRREADAVRSRLRRLAAATGSRRALRGEITQLTQAARVCPGCAASGLAAERSVTLAAAAMPDRRVRDRLAGSHGFCAEHAPAVAARAGDALPVTVARARLQTLAFELDDAVRKRSWWVRHEPKGPEMAAWRSAPTLLRGSAYLGLTAPSSTGTPAYAAPEEANRLPGWA